MKKLHTLILLMLIPAFLNAQPETPVEEWTGRTVLFIGAHPDDDSGSHGTMAMLQDNGNEVYVLLLTTGNVGTKDSSMTRDRLAKIRKKEEIDALAALGIPEDHYINLGYTDGMVEFADAEEVVKRMVYWIRKLKPETMIAFDPGWGYQKWRKSDHRAASYLAADAARAAEWRLIFPGQIVQDGMEAHKVTDYLFFSEPEEATNTYVNISDYGENKVQSISKYISQFTSGWENYRGPDLDDLPGDEGKKYLESLRKRVFEEDVKDGQPHEAFRYYKGMPDGIGRRN
jgi:LmbE family N-acetylglucosaminyl deacetylase